MFDNHFIHTVVSRSSVNGTAVKMLTNQIPQFAGFRNYIIAGNVLPLYVNKAITISKVFQWWSVQ